MKKREIVTLVQRRMSVPATASPLESIALILGVPATDAKGLLAALAALLGVKPTAAPAPTAPSLSLSELRECKRAGADPAVYLKNKLARMALKGKKR